MCYALCIGGGHWTYCTLPKGHATSNHRDSIWLPVITIGRIGK